jgi:prevent-host-death family protein
MRMITATEANRDFSKLLEQVVDGDTIKITKHGKVVATISPEEQPRANMEELRRLHLAELRSRVPIPGLKRGTRAELYED